MAGVAFGAFGAHALKTRLGPEALSLWQTAVLYHLVHALALVGVGLAGLHWPGSRALYWSGVLMGLGIVLFSGSLYVMALSGEWILGLVTPFGGLAFLAGWLCLAFAAWRPPRG
jgi:uncharacterized membrane protein YgdD (TMEM256/DUF423 family)